MIRRIRHAHTKARADQRIERLEFRFGERVGLVIPGNDLGRAPKKIGRSHDRVGDANRQVTHARAMNHVAEVDQAHHTAIVHQHVVVVGVVVEESYRQCRKTHRTDGLVTREESFDQLSTIIGEVREVVANPVRPREIPLQVSRNTRRREVRKGGVHQRQGAPQTSEHRHPVRRAICPNVPWDERHHTDKILVRANRDERLTIDRWHNAGHHEFGNAGAEMI